MKKRVTELLTVFLMMIGMILVTNYGVEKVYAAGEDPNANGAEGTEESPYIINEPDDLVWMSVTVATQGGMYYVQTANIDMTGVTINPIGQIDWGDSKPYTPFYGTYDGQGYRIDNLSINSAENEVGLFGDIADGYAADDTDFSGPATTPGTIKNITLHDISIYGSKTLAKIGGLIGINSGATVSNCHITGNSVISGEEAEYVGGIVGQSLAGIITGCSNNATVSTGNTTNHYSIGGVVANMDGGNITNCSNTGNVIGGNTYTDGSDSTFFGIAGGVVAYFSNELTSMSYCYSSGDISVGATGDNIEGGVIGNYDSGTVQNTFYLDTSATYGINANAAQPPSFSGATAKTAEELKTKTTFDGWNFTGVWNMIAGETPTHKRAPVDILVNRTDGQVEISWSPVAYATGYKVYQGTTKGSYTEVATINTNSTSTTVTGLNNTEVYYFVVTTTDAYGDSPYSYAVKSTIPRQITPTFSATGAIAYGTTVTITSEGANHIYYTTNGDDPTISSTEYTDPVTVSSALTIKALAIRTGFGNSAIGSASYTQAATSDLTGIVLSGSPSSYTFAGNTYTYDGVSVVNEVSSITVTPTGTGIITVDGVTVSSTVASAAIALTPGEEKEITVAVQETGKTGKTYTIKVTRAMVAQATPTFSTPGAIAYGTKVTITSAGADHIYYTTNGDDPTITSTEYTEPITVSSAITIKALAVKSNYYNSVIGSASYTQAATADLTGIVLSGSPSSYTFAGNTYSYSGVSVLNEVSSITVTPTGTGIITVDGVTVSSTVASAEIALTPGEEKEITVAVQETGKTGKTYTIKVTRAMVAQATPTFSTPGAIAYGTKVTITSAGADHIYYTTNGDDPTITSTEYTEPITVSSAITIKALAVKSNFYNSVIGSASYTQAATADLTGIVLSGSPSSYNFAGNTYTYSGVSVLNGVSSITVTPTGNGMITVDGVTVNSTEASASITLTIGVEKEITVAVQETGKTGKTYIIRVTRASSNSNGSGNMSGTIDQGLTQKPATEVITVDVKNGNTDDAVSKITIDRTTDVQGNKSDVVTYQPEKATETIEQLKAEGKDVARIVIPDDKDEVSETIINIPSKALDVLAEGDINLQIDTQEVKIDIPKDSFNSVNGTLKDDLYFNLVPIKESEQISKVENRAKFEVGLLNENNNSMISVVGNPVTIETNMPSSAVDITLPLTGINIPADPTEREAFLKQLAVYIEHSDGTKELVQGEIVEYKNGVKGIKFHITKFSIFTIVKTDAFSKPTKPTKSTECNILTVENPKNVTITGKNITARVSNETTSLTIKVNTSEKATWKLYSDKAGKKKLTAQKLKLKVGVNKAYIIVTAEDGKTSKVYTVAIIRQEKKVVEYTSHIKLGVIGSKTYAEKVAGLFEKNSNNTKVVIKEEGKYYRVYVDFIDKATAKAFCKDLINKKIIINYYFITD